MRERPQSFLSSYELNLRTLGTEDLRSSDVYQLLETTSKYRRRGRDGAEIDFFVLFFLKNDSTK